MSAKIEGVEGIEECYVSKRGVVYYVDLHIEVDGKLTKEEGHPIAHRVKDKVMNANGSIKNVFIHVAPYSHH